MIHVNMRWAIREFTVAVLLSIAITETIAISFQAAGLPWWSCYVVSLAILLGGLVPYRRWRMGVEDIRPPEIRSIWIDTRPPREMLDDMQPDDPLVVNYIVPMMRGQLSDNTLVLRHAGGLFEVFDPGRTAAD